MRNAMLLALSLLTASANAEVYKCIEKFGKTRYQASPCSENAKEQKLDIKTDPAQEAAAKARLEEVQSEYDSRKAEKEKIDKELAAQQRANAELEIARRNAISQQEQAQAQQRQADALERQNRFNNRPLYVFPPALPAQRPIMPRLPRQRTDSRLIID